MEILIPEYKIRRYCKRIAKEIRQEWINNSIDYDGIVLVGILNGAMPFLTDLSRYIHNEIPVEIDTISCSSYTGIFMKSKIKFHKAPTSNLENKLVIIVDDIADTGDTLIAVQERISREFPTQIQTCCLLKRKSCKLDITYLGKVIEENLWVVGYGLDDNQLKRNLRDIYVK